MRHDAKVVVSKTSTSRAPTVRLSRWDAVVAVAIAEDEDENSLNVKDLNGVRLHLAMCLCVYFAFTRAGIHFLNLTPAVTTRHLRDAMARSMSSYTLQWIDDQNCVAVFPSHSHAQNTFAMLRDSGTCPFDVRLCAFASQEKMSVFKSQANRGKSKYVRPGPSVAASQLRVFLF